MTERIHVLYVDDEPDLLKLGKVFLEKQDLSVDTLTSVDQALILIPDRQYDVIISDYQMPGKDGITFLKAVRASGNSIPFILFTGRGREEVVIEALNEGADFYLQKGGDPVAQFTELIHEIRSAVSRRYAEQDLKRKNEELSAVNEELIATEEELRVQYTELARQEQEIRESEERFLGFFNSSLVGIAITDPDGRWLYFNDKLCIMLGYSPDELKTKTWGDLTPPEDLEHEIVIFQSVLAGKAPENIEKQYIRKDFSRIDVIVSTGVVRNPDGTIAYFSSVILDITDRKRVEEENRAAYEELAGAEEELRANITELTRKETELRNTGERLLWAQEIGKTGSWEFQPETNTIWGSAEGLRIFGFPAVAGDFPIDEIEACIPERERVNQALVELITRDIPYDLEYTIQPADGSAEKVIHSIARAEKDSNGELIRIIGIIQDITRQKSIERDQQTLITLLGKSNEQLEASHEELAGSQEELRQQFNLLSQTDEQHRKTIDLLENLIAIAHVPIIVWDSEFRIVRINHIIEHITGRPAEACIGAHLKSLLSPDLADRITRLLDTTHSGVKWKNVELPILHLDGSQRTILWNTSTLFDSDGITPVATLAQGKDVTDERRYAQEKEAAIVEIQKNIAQLAILNDEIRNPLTIIVTCADLLGNEELLDQIMVQTQRIDGMVTNLDQRWADSEKVLNAIRRHYQIEVQRQRDSSPEDESDHQNNGPNLMQPFLVGGAGILLMEEVQAQLYTILDSIDALVYVADMQTYDLLYINQWGRAYLGNIAGKKCYQALFPGQDAPCSFCTNCYLMNKNRPAGVYRWEKEAPKSGRWFDCRDRAIKWNDGRWVRLEIATDITQRKRIEQSLRESESQCRLLADNIGDVVWTADTDMRLTYVSPSILHLTGYTQEEFMGLRPDESLTPESLSRLIQSRQMSMNTILSGDLKQCRPATLELEYRTRDGLTVPTETTISLLFCEEDGLQGVVGVTRDITARKLADAASRENETRYREIFESLDDLYYETDENENIAVLSPSVYPLSGWMIEDLIGTPAKDLYVNPEDREILISEISKNGFVKDYELLLRKKDGTPIPISLSGSVIKKPDGRPGGIRGSLRDISKRKCTEELLRKSEARFRSYIDNAPDGVFIADEKGNYTFVNDAACTTTGYSREELLQKNLLDLIYPDDISLASAHFQNLIEKGIWSGELRFVTRAGDIRWWVVKAVRLTTVQFLGFASDITDRKKAEEKVNQLLKQIEFILDATYTRLDIIDKDFNLRYVDSGWQAIYGDFQGRKCYEYFMDRTDPCPECGIPSALKLNNPFRSEEILIKEGNRPIEVVTIPFRDENGEYLVAEVNIDITERKKAEEALFASNQKLRLLTGLTRHDTINKLAAIHLLHDLAIRESDPEKREEYLIQASQAIGEAEAIISFTKEYEDFGIASSGWLQAEPLIRQASSEILHPGIHTDLNIPPDFEIFADPIIRKVFSTLIENAARHGGSLTRISFSCMEEDRDTILICEDDGCGIPVEEKERIFDHGYGKNTGLGLFLAREILAITGLSIRETGEPGKGARFEILVPEGKWRRERN